MPRAALRGISGAHLVFRCPACDTWHTVRVQEPHNWSWNGDLERPTLSPSVFVNAPGNQHRNPAAPSCHSFVTDGRIQFLGDCTHSLAGQTVDLPEVGDP